MPEKIITMPRPASPSMLEALGVFLVEQRRRLSLRSYQAYEVAIDEFALFLHAHGAEELEGTERALLKATTLHCGCSQDDYITRFGPEHLLRNLERFLASCRGPVPVTDRHRARMTLRVARTLREWLMEGGWCEPEAARSANSAPARLQFERSRRIAKAMADEIAALELESEDINSDDDWLEGGLHDVSQIRGDDLWFDYWPESGPVRQHVGPVHFPMAARVLQPGWVVGGTLGRVWGRWCLLEVSCVYSTSSR